MSRAEERWAQKVPWTGPSDASPLAPLHFLRTASHRPTVPGAKCTLYCALPRFLLVQFQRVIVSNTKSSDIHFFNSFSVVLGILIFFAIILFGVARSIGADTQGQAVLLEPLHLKDVRDNI